MRDYPLPFTPRALRAELAALYVGVSESWWLLEVKAGRAPSPVYLSPRIPVWLREDLDAWLDEKAGRDTGAKEPNPWDEVFEVRDYVFLHHRERLALEHTARSPHAFENRLGMPAGVGEKTLDGLVSRGLMQKGPCQHRNGEEGWGLTEAGRRAITRRG